MNDLETYEKEVQVYLSKLPNNKTKQEDKTWTFINAMFYAGTIYTTIGKGFWTKPIYVPKEDKEILYRVHEMKLH